MLPHLESFVGETRVAVGSYDTAAAIVGNRLRSAIDLRHGERQLRARSIQCCEAV